MDTYIAGDGPQNIALTVDISTIGLAGTRANISKPGVPPISVAHSVDVTGDIQTTNIGSANSLNGNILTISTLVDLKIIGDLEARKKEYDIIRSTYILEKGIDGHKVYDVPDNKVPANDYSTVVLVKQIILAKS